jgi:lysophospholipase L1-like esterase
MALIRRYVALTTILLVGLVAISQPQNKQKSGERWVSTWATAQQLAPATFPGAGGGRSGSRLQEPPRPQSTPQQQSGGRGNPSITFSAPSTLEDQTVRMIVHTSLGGRRIRVNLSNGQGMPLVRIDSARIAIHKGGGAIVSGTDRTITFNGKPSCVLLPGVLTISDPVDMEVHPFSDLAISLYLPHQTDSPANHMLGMHTAYISKGNAAGQEVMPGPTTMFAYLWLAGIDVLAQEDAFTIVALGDSITDGYATTLDANRAWPALLAKRLHSNKDLQRIAVVNQGISGNQVLRDGFGISALARFDRDVLSIAGVKWVILLEGINDINIRGRSDEPDAVTSDDLIAGYRQIIERSHTHGIRVVGATLMPEEGVPTMSERGEQIRQAVNQWIRTCGLFDAIVDFDAVIRDPSRPIRMRPDLDPGDHIHPNDAGNQAMADAFDLKLFRN